MNYSFMHLRKPKIRSWNHQNPQKTKVARFVNVLLLDRSALMECGESGEDASGNADQILRNRGSIWTEGRRPEVRIEPQFRRMKIVFPNTSEPDAQC